MQEPQKTGIRSLGGEDPLEKEMGTHSSILAWEVPCTEESGRLPSTGSQKSKKPKSGPSSNTEIVVVV